MRQHLVVMVCTGNVCRSPMAEYLLRARLGPNAGWDVCSAGVSASFGVPASREAVDVLRDRQVDLTLHSSRPLSRELVDAADLIVVMTRDHRDMIGLFFPDVLEKVRLMMSFDERASGRDVPDPIGMTRDMYRKVRDEIEAALPGLVAYLEEMAGQ